MKNIILASFFIISNIFSQEEIYTKNGNVIFCQIDTSSLSESSTSVRYKKPSDKKHKYLNINSISFIRSWNGSLIYPKGVIVNTTSGKIHLPNVKHLPDQNISRKFETKEIAIQDGFTTCSACFDSSPTLADQAIEKDLSMQTILAIKNQNEIIYEHEKLPFLRSLVNKVLSNWPEQIKGYDYRIQVIRSKEPNAMAVPGGNLYFSTGLLELAEDDFELESIVAHEIAHVERRHSLRGYKEYLKKQQVLAISGAALGLFALATDSDVAAASSVVLTTVGAFALEFSQKGYDRDLEQEADMFAQIYNENNNLSKKYMLSALDKFAVHSSSRIGYVPKSNNYSSHPDLMMRMNQFTYGKTFNYEKPVSITFQNYKKKTGIKDGFITININYLFTAPSSNNSTKNEIAIAGTIFNNDKNYSFRIDQMILNFIGTLGKQDINGLVDIIIPRNNKLDFIGRITVPSNQTDEVLQSLIEKKFIPYGVNVSAVILTHKKEIEEVPNLKNMKCGLLVE